MAATARLGEQAGPRKGTGRLASRLTPWLLLLPVAVSLGAVSVYPIFEGLRLSLTNTSLVTQEHDFIGLRNYEALIADPLFWNAWRHTVFFTFVSTLAETLIGLAMALLLFEHFTGRGMIRAAMLVPWAMPTVVTSKMFGWLFDGQYGLVNYLLRSVGLIDQNVNWYGSIDNAMATIIIADVWKTTPFMALLLLAGLQTVPKSLIEAARIDGAGAWSTFWNVRLPLLMPTLLIAGMFRALDAFRVFDLVYVLTGGGPADSTETLSTFSYKILFSTLQFGYGSALSTAMFVTEALIAAGFGYFIMRKMRSAR
ncbi:carbohydrate ABC transporter permease [Prosthecomicrobium pneumaticum]|uniref:Multiple sugar transport system permease protein n=1 Tax=Prosthecomicrobium pneumaticum TaxID=81895 RepID=A0A7W9CTJ2_9HYPH|nr:sugar ABC transporter permease [Prosthecomicrobium pneumaticum]MBB5751582.1 multiple sugar transport system permease protein [Prosthecomicrobium pneumaticum]